MSDALDGMTVDAVVAAALVHHGHDVAETMRRMIDHNQDIGIPVFDFPVHVDLGLQGAGGTVVKGFRWQPAGRYALGREGLRCVSMALTDTVRWTGPANMPERTGEGIVSRAWGSRLVVDRPRWPATMAAASAGRRLREIVDHPWLAHDGLIVKGCTVHEDGRFASLWVDEVLLLAPYA